MPGRVRGSAVRLVPQLVLTLVLGLLAGTAGGWLWEHFWTPASGVAFAHGFVLDGQGAPQDFSATGSYVVWALVMGLAAGLLAGLVGRQHELVTLVTLVVAAAAGGVLMAMVGHALGPPDPEMLARSLDDFQPLTSDLRVSGLAPYLAMPAGALLGLATEFLGEAGIHLVRHPAPSDPATLSR